MDIQVCPFCGAPITAGENFCPHCGKQLVQANTPLGWGRQAYIYAVSLLAPPFGLIWTVKYLRLADNQKRRVGIIAGVITILSFILTMWWFVGFWNSIQQQINTYSNLGM